MPQPTDDEVANGSLITELNEVAPVAELCGMQVRLVNGAVPPASRRCIAHLAYVAQRSMLNFKTGYDGTVDEDDQRLYVLCSTQRAIGLVLTAIQDRFWSVAWGADGSICRSSEQPIVERRITVARVWVATNHRGSGLGRKLLEAALSHLRVPAVDTGWEFPFSDSGSQLVRHLCPSHFLACCDNMSIMLNTRPCAENAGAT